jgi:hypothetical protein
MGILWMFVLRGRELFPGHYQCLQYILKRVVNEFVCGTTAARLLECMCLSSSPFVERTTMFDG